MSQPSRPASPPSSVPTSDVSEIVFVLDPGGVIQFATPAAAGFYGYESGELVGQTALQFVDPAEAEAIRAGWAAFINDPAAVSHEFPVTLARAGGQRLRVRVTVWWLPGRDELLAVHHVFDRLRDRLDTLYAILAAVSGVLDLDELLDNVLTEVHRLVPCDTATIYMVEGDGMVRVRRWHEGHIEEFRTVPDDQKRHFITTRQMRATGQPLLIDDTATDDRWITLPDHRPIRSWLGAPLVHQGEFFGELNLDSKRPHAFGEEDADLVRALATQVAAALFNARRYAEEQERASRFQALNDLHNAINHLDLASVLEVLYRQISGMMDTSSFYVALYDRELNQVRLTGAYEHGQPDPDVVQDADEGLVGRVIRTRQAIIVQNIERDGLPDGAVILGEVPLSLVMIPLIVQQEIVGVLSVQSYQPDAYTDDDIALLEIMAGAIATVVQNAQLYDETRTRLTALEALHLADLRLTNLHDPAAIAELALQTVLDLFSPTEARLCLCTSHPWPSRGWTGRPGEAMTSHDNPQCADPPPGSLNERVCIGGQIFVAADLRDHPHLQAEFDTPWPAEAVAAYPLQRGDQRFGALVLLYDRPTAFRQDALRTLEMLSSQVAAAFEDVSHTLALRRQLVEVSALQEMAQHVSASQSLDDILHTVVQNIRGVYDCRSASITLLDPATGEVTVQASVSVQQQAREEARYALGEYVSRRVAASGGVLYVPDTEVEPAFQEVDPAIRSMLAVPLTVQDRVIGTLSIDSAAPDAFTQQHERVLTIAGSQIAATIETVRRTQDLAEANAQLRAQEQFRADLLIQVTHDLRSPLGLVQGYAGLLKDGAFGPVTGDQVGILTIIEQRSDSIRQLTEDILSTRPIDRSTLVLTPLDISQLSEQAVRDAQLVYGNNRVRFETDLAGGQFVVAADRHRLNRVFDNLIGNAVKFSPDGGTITVCTRPGPGARRVLVSITDEGIGIAPDKLPHIFERFFRGDKAFRERFKGSGVGLYNVRQIIQAHDGEIWVESQEGAGSTFIFALPLAER